METKNENLFVKGTPGAGFGNEVFTNDLSYVINTLSVQQRDEITDILRDYEEYFVDGIIEGKSEIEIIESLGSPKEIASSSN